MDSHFSKYTHLVGKMEFSKVLKEHLFRIGKASSIDLQQYKYN